MLDFLMIATRSKKNGVTEVYPKFIIKKSEDLMIRGGDFYAIWDEERELWSTEEQDALRMIDKIVKEEYEKIKVNYPNANALYMWDSESGIIDSWHKYCQKQMRDNYHVLDEKLIFSNDKTDKKDYASKRLSYPLVKGEISAYDKLMSTLYSEEERQKIEWAIGSIVTGDSKNIQKFLVLYGAAGTGKSTILNIIQKLFDGYYSVFDAKALGSSNNAFALEAFKNNPLVAIQHDGDLSRIEDNTRLNSLVSHELMTVNEKFKSTYTNRFNAFLFMGTNKPVKITDAKSGLIRRLIDVSPTGEKIPIREYKRLIKQINFELGAIANYCKDVYLANPGKYDEYIPISMLGASNDFYNFVEDSYLIFKQDNGVSLKAAWTMYKKYCEDANITYPFSQRVFKEELKNYFKEFKDRFTLEDGTRVRNYYCDFRTDRFEIISISNKEDGPEENLIKFEETESIFDKEYADCFAQYANDDEKPFKKWDDVTTKLRHLDTSKLHYVRVPENHIVIDFDIKDETGKKSFEKNLIEASKFPPTYAELSKSGAGIHLHYIYDGDVNTLNRIYDDDIEVKIFTGKSSLRRKLTKCNKLPIATLHSGLPLRKGKKMLNFDGIKNEQELRRKIRKNLNKEYHGATKPSVDFIYKLLTDAHDSGINYDVSDMRTAILSFAANSTNQADYCVKLVSKMPFKSENYVEPIKKNDNVDIVFYDIEVFPNLFVVCWKKQGEKSSVVKMVNPKPHEIEELMKYRLVGFNCRRYDNHLLYARGLLGYNNEQLYKLSQRIVNGDRNAFFGDAYCISYTDVYDFSSEKKSLKKWEIELGIHHQELGLPWDQPVAEELWEKVADYCCNDVLATEAVFDARQADFIAREILVDIVDLPNITVNDTTNSLTAKFIFGNNRHPQDQFNYRDLSGGEIDRHTDYTIHLSNGTKIYGNYMEGQYTVFNSKNQPIFPGYVYDKGKSTYREEEVGEGGYVYSEPGMYVDVALLDIASMHPSSIIAEQLFGPDFTKRFQEILDARIAIKHKDFDKAKNMLGGKLAKYLTDESMAKSLAQALKIVINSVYGLTSAAFENPFRDIRNKDNIVAKRGALFMINLKHEVQERGFTVAHIKTDSIKIPNATPEIIQFVMDYGKLYGYNFEHEATYDRMCLVNDAVYIAKYKEGGEGWTATGTQFQVPYVFKKLFSKEPIVFEDYCETKSVAKGDLYLDMNEKLPDVSAYEKEQEKLWKKINNPKTLDRPMEAECNRIEELTPLVDKGHNYVFVGRVGQFCPIKEGCGGGILYRKNENKYYAVTGTKGYRWLESEMVRNLGKEDDIDKSYYETLANDAVNDISKYGDFEWFTSEDGKPFLLTDPKDLVISDPLPETFTNTLN